LGVLVASPAPAQAVRRILPPASLFPTLHAGASEAVTAARLVVSIENPTLFGQIVEGEASFGASVPLVLMVGSSTSDAIVAGVEGGVVARFNLETRERDLIASDWMFAVPLVIHRGSHWLRLRYFHTSAHLGDEYLQRFAVARVPYARDALEAVGLVQVERHVGVYAGARWAFRVDPPWHRRTVLRAGAEFGNGPRGAPVRPYGAVDAELDAQSNWRPRVTVEAGGRLAAPSGREMRLVLEFVTGPTAMGQFAPLTATYVAVGVEFGL
jgi:hypothetical protein